MLCKIGQCAASQAVRTDSGVCGVLAFGAVGGGSGIGPGACFTKQHLV